ncbi:Equilibrative nucleoside transporter 1 [Chionoecetes opilio]|uniref:Equilibrative nucleoside transporter 1 n=1 Tax=Chionoecetes opilio TaxID=41210 RepID=A0A8J4XRY2_CHIOP|nr:Equilibrative nucleoside transporter 1 [Chionoecetes opilio]
MPLSDTSYRRLSPTINMYSEETGRDYLAPLASVEDLSRVNTPGGSPSPRPRQRHPALEDPNWEPPADPSLPGLSRGPPIILEPGVLTPLQADFEPLEEGPRDRYRLVFLTLVLHGVGTLMPWNMFITAKNVLANGIYQNTVYGMAARLPSSYTGAVVLGSNISGTFTAIINIMAIAMAPNTRTSAIYYFITALFVLLACFDTYFALPLNVSSSSSSGGSSSGGGSGGGGGSGSSGGGGSGGGSSSGGSSSSSGGCSSSGSLCEVFVRF